MFTKRIHLISEEINDWRKVNNSNYIGYFVLRPIDIEGCKLIKIIARPTKQILGAKNSDRIFLITCNFTVHIGGREISFRTFPFYQQDSMITVCAHADMWMIAEYMHRKFRFNKPSIGNFASLTLPFYGRTIPSPGLTVEQINTILNRIGYNTSLEEYSKKDIKEMLKRLDAYLESGLPTILAFGNHVCIIAGHTLDGDGNRDYILYDDSGYHLEKLTKDNQFVNIVSQNKLIKRIKRFGKLLTINVEFDKLYYPVESVEWHVDKFLSSYGLDVFKIRKRILLVDSSKFKDFIKNSIPEFEQMPLPHYLWIVELYTNEYDKLKPFGVIIMNASAHKRDLKNILAIWIGSNFWIFKPKYKEISVGTLPEVYGNLDPIA